MVINKNHIQPGDEVYVNLNSYKLPTRTIIEVPVYVKRAFNDGPVILFSAGMHGDETNGIEILRSLIHYKHFDKLKKGSVIVIPIVNIVSFLNNSRELPDGRDLNRCFPGSRNGSLGSRIAFDIMNDILPQIDFGVDFHTGGASINNYPQIRCVLDDPQNLDLAKMFAPPFIINSPFRDKSFRKEAAKKGKSILVYEAGESLRFSKSAVTEGIYGCLRMLNKLGMLDVEVPDHNTLLLKDSSWIRARTSGLFITYKKYGKKVEKGETIGVISDPYGEAEFPLFAQDDGFIIGINNSPVVNLGDALIHIGHT